MRKSARFIGGVGRLTLILALGGLGPGGSEARAGFLNDIRAEVRKEKKEEKEKEEERDPPPRRGRSASARHSHHSHHSRWHGSHSLRCSYCAGDSGEFPVALRIFFSPFWGPWAAVEEGEIEHPAYLDYPYERGQGGYIQDNARGSQSALSVTAEGGRAPYGYHQTIDARFTVARRFEFEVVAKRIVEPLNPVDEDQVFLMQSHFNVPFAMGKHALFRAGLGVNSLLDPRSHPISGINFHYDMDFFPVRPLVVSFRFGAGTVGEAVLTQARGTVGVSVRNAELYAGYDQQWLGDHELGGPIGGVRLWF